MGLTIGKPEPAPPLVLMQYRLLP